MAGWAFTGRDWDPETGLAHYRTRYLDPRLGRFVSEDLIGLRGGLNLHGYAANRPVRLIDPWGKAPKTPAPIPYPKPEQDSFCYDEYMRCEKEAACWVAAWTLPCVVVCAAPPLPPLGKAVCLMGCLFGAVAAYAKIERTCRDQYYECVKRHPPDWGQPSAPQGSGSHD